MDLICDLDGTVWQGNAVFPGVSEAVARTRAAGLPRTVRDQQRDSRHSHSRG